jgi:hypothetical protein
MRDEESVTVQEETSTPVVNEPREGKLYFAVDCRSLRGRELRRDTNAERENAGTVLQTTPLPQHFCTTCALTPPD